MGFSLKPSILTPLHSSLHEAFDYGVSARICRKLLMRWTVLSSDVLIFFPAVLYFVLVYRSIRFGTGQNNDVTWHIAMILLNPCLILIDHGHFQYNCISLGLTIAAIAAALSQKDLVASVLYCLPLNHK
ncbi:hypothetical protein J1N35_043806 [Gossypium stocksii]|uniref:Alpha-1,3-glucosyltransferase n=1 Tax=Gossypium stocksii TaxID=47602 RepID=A0A9D3U828_9ROSI|nr:hypothetical protein J1N35_043806 [Gossypium stocksii]